MEGGADRDAHPSENNEAEGRENKEPGERSGEVDFFGSEASEGGVTAIRKPAPTHRHHHDAGNPEPENPPRSLGIGGQEGPQGLAGIIRHDGVGRKGEPEKHVDFGHL